MSILEAAVLGLVQGLTEFLPVSSSGHLVLAEHLMGVKTDDVTFEVAIHFATLIALGVYFFPILNRIFISPFRLISGADDRKTWRDFRLLLVIAVATIPAVLVGLLLGDYVEQAFQSATVVSIMLLVTSAVLFLTLLAKPGENRVGFRCGFLIGCAQALAIMPGISRSGSTIATALFAGVSRLEAFNFSFVLSVPAILGATALTAAKIEGGIAFTEPSYLVGMFVAFVSGYFSIMLLQKLVVSGRFYLFGIYTLIVGLAGLIFVA